MPHDALGLTPFHKSQQDVHSIKKKTNPILLKHKKWLEEFSNQQKLKKEVEEHQKWEREEHLQKIKEQAQKNREETRNMKN